jgi:hypothetical protein
MQNSYLLEWNSHFCSFLLMSSIFPLFLFSELYKKHIMAYTEKNVSMEARVRSVQATDVEPLQLPNPLLGSRDDIGDMRRLGKKQELMVLHRWGLIEYWN